MRGAWPPCNLEVHQPTTPSSRAPARRQRPPAAPQSRRPATRGWPASAARTPAPPPAASPPTDRPCTLPLPAAAAPEAPAAASKPEPSYSGAAETYAVVEIGGHQLIVEEGRWYTVNRLEVCLAGLGWVYTWSRDG